jgi:hypothetical protein
MLKRIVAWLMQGWPILAFLPLLAIHLLILELPWWTTESFNKLLALILQILGGLIILDSIDSNLGTFKQYGLLTLFKRWIKSFPHKREVIQIVSGGGVVRSVSSGEAHGSYKQTFANVEDTLKYLQDQIDGLQQKIVQDKKFMLKKIDETKNELQSENKKTIDEIKSLSGILENFAIGSIKQQLFGFMLLIYSAVLGFLS